MRSTRVIVVVQATYIRTRVLEILRDIEQLIVTEEGPPDMICLACEDELSPIDVARARELGGLSRVPVALIAWNGSEKLAIQALRAGIKEYVSGASSREEIARVLLSLCPTEDSPKLAAGEMLVGESAAIRGTKTYIERVARTCSNVLITGETGTGKELIAELIHRNSPRAHKPFVCVNCAAIPDTLLESELFGFERGAFTGAHRAQDGKFKLADGGTVFLDEIGDMSPYAQAKILRVLEGREVQRLGSVKPQRVDFRVVAATNRDLENLSNQEQFRRDLFFRLNVARIHLPPLRDRAEDLLTLAHYFRQEYNRTFGRETVGFTQRAERAILQHPWPGNVRELKNMVEAAFISLDAGSQWVELPELFCRAIENSHEASPDEAVRIAKALSEAHWNKSKAAEILSWSRMTLYRKMERYGMMSQGHPTISAKA